MSRLHELRRILLEDEQRSLDELRSRVADAEARAADVAEVLPAAVRASNTGDELIESLREPVGRVIHDSVRNDPDSFADALFPVIGPAIRKAVAESIRALADRINKAVEQSISWNGLKWRLEAARTGVPLADIIVRETLLFDTEELFVIERESGLLIAHLDKEGSTSANDSDAVSAMLTAIRDFVRDSFGGDDGNDLDSVAIGGRTVWISYGPNAMLAAVFTGNPPASLRADFYAVNESVHRRYARAIERFNGDRTAFDGIDALLRPLLQSALVDAERPKQTSYKPLVIVAVLVALLFAVWFGFATRERARIEHYVAALDAVPGLIVLDYAKAGGATRVRVLRDPLSTVPADLPANYRLDDSTVVLDALPFMSGHPDIVLERIRRTLEAPSTVAFAWRDNIVVASGTATNSWLTRAQALPVGWAGIADLDLTGVQTAEARLIAELRTRFDVPESVQLALSADVVRASGVAPIDWLLSLDDAREDAAPGISLDTSAVRVDLASLAAHLRERAGDDDAFAYDLGEQTLGIYGTATVATRDYLRTLIDRFRLEQHVDMSRLKVIDVQGLRELLERYRDFKLTFTSGTTLTAESAAALSDALPDLVRIVTLGSALPEPFVVRVTGFTDGRGRPALNEQLRARRAQYVAKRLIGAGADAESIAVSAGPTPPEAVEDRTWRRVTITFE